MRCRVALVVAAALVASGCTQAGAHKVATTTAVATASTAAASVATTSPAAGSVPVVTSASGVPQLEATLAAAGVATVADEQTSTPAVAVSGSPVLTLTAWQVANLDAEAAGHGGISGADLDTMLPMPPTAPAFADILGGWVIAGGDATAAAAGALLDTPDWTHPEQVVFPTAVLTLFEADLLQHVSAATPAGAQSSDAAWRAATPSIEDASLVTAPCSAVSNFVNDVLDKVFGLLKVNPTDVSNFVNGVVGGGLLGAIAGGLAGFLTGFWNHAVDLAQQAVNGILSALTQPVLNAIALVAGGVAVISTIRSYLQQWTAGLTADPTGNTFPIAPKTNPGTVTVAIDTKAEIQDWPPQLVDCAQAAGVELPTLAKAGSPVTWTAVGQEPGLITTGAVTGTLDQDLKQKLTYVTGNEDATTHTKGALVSPTVTTTVQVRRTEVEELRKFVTAYITGKVPAIVAPVLNPILAYYIEEATKYLDKITAVTGTTTFVVSHHVPKPTPPCVASGTTIPAGTYSGPLTETIDITLQGAHGTNTGAGTITIVSDGKNVTGSIDVHGSGNATAGIITDTSIGTMTGTISGSAANPIASGTLQGSSEVAGAVSSPFRAGLHITRASCASVSGDLVAMFSQIYAEFTNLVTVSGTGAWTIPSTK